MCCDDDGDVEECEDGADMEDAVIKVGDSEGEFIELNKIDIERDVRFPVRITLQFYKASGDGKITNEIMAEIAK